MSESGQPRRWAQNTLDGLVHWREDTATEADVEAVSMLLADVAPDGDMFTRKRWCDAKARFLLSTIFKG